MDILKIAEPYLKNLYIKSIDRYKDGFNEELIRQLTGISQQNAENIQAYLADKNLISLAKHKGDNNIYLTPQGIDHVAKLRENKIFNTIKFTHAGYLHPGARAVTSYIFYYDLIDEEGGISNKLITVMISDMQGFNWGYPLWSSNPDTDYKDLVKILLQFAKDKISEKLQEGTLIDHEEMILLTTNSPADCPYNPELLPNVENAEFEIEIGQKILGLEINENKLAASIIETRDIINALFHDQFKEKLLLLNQERNLLDFFKTATTVEEFSHRMASLAEVSRNLNIGALRKVTGNNNDTTLKSIQLLKLFYQMHQLDGNKVTETLVNIGRIRQGYPMHTDLAGIISALDYFNLKYPLKDYEQAWITILSEYLSVLLILRDTLINLFVNKVEI